MRPRREPFTPCLSSGIFGRRPLVESVPPIAAAGFRWVEISRRSTQWVQAAPVLADHGVGVWSVHGPGVFFLDDPSDATCDQAIEQEKQAMAQAAVYAPCPYVLHYFRAAPGPVNDARCVDRVETLARQCVDAGLELCMELLPVKPGPERYSGNAAELVALLDRVTSASVSICIDTNHTNLVEDLPAAIRVAGGRIGNVHISDNLGVTDDHLPPGEGIIDWPAVLRALRDAGYRGPLNMEIHSKEIPSRDMLVRLRAWAETAGEGGISDQSGL